MILHQHSYRYRTGPDLPPGLPGAQTGHYRGFQEVSTDFSRTKCFLHSPGLPIMALLAPKRAFSAWDLVSVMAHRRN